MNFWQYTDIDDDTANLRFYGDVTSDEITADYYSKELNEEFITPAGFAEDMAKCANKKVVNISLNSCGGDAYLGLAIHNQLKALKAKKIITIDGIAASAAATIACSADVLRMYPGSLLMIHNVKSFLSDMAEQQDLKKLMRGMEAIEKASAAIYAAKSGLTETNIRALMEKETWYTGAEALAAGFADELISDDADKTGVQMLNKTTAIINGLNIDLERVKLPGRVFTNKKITTKQDKGVKPMTLDELKKDYPELVSEIANVATQEAVALERARIAAIDEIADSVNDAALVKAAKFSDVCTAEQLAFRALQNAAKTGKKFLEARSEELAPAANVAAAKAAPAIDSTDARKMQEAADEAVIASAIKAVNAIK